MDPIITAATTDVSRYVVLLDSTTGAPKTGVSPGSLSLAYVRPGAAAASPVTASALSAADDAHADNKAIEVDATNLPGVYRVDWPDAAFASGADGVILGITASGVIANYERVQLAAADLYDAANMGLSALPTADAGADGGIPTADGFNRVAGVAAGVDIASISGSSPAADALEASLLSIQLGTVSDAVASPTTTELRADDVTEATADHFVGRLIVFTSGNLAKQVAEITDYELASGEGKFTVTELTEAPANDDTFAIL